MAQKTTPSEIAKLSFEDALKELEDIVRRLEAGNAKLDEALAAYERGALLAGRCAALLDRTEQKISQLVVGAGGRIAERPLEPQEAVREAAPDLPAPPARRAAAAGDDIDPDDIPF